MPRWGIADRPDANQAEIVKRLRELGYYVRVTKRPVDLWVVEPSRLRAAWVEVKSGYADELTPQEAKFFAECPERHRLIAVTVEDVTEHFDKCHAKRMTNYTSRDYHSMS